MLFSFLKLKHMELYIEPIKLQRNPKNGQLLKGCKVHNKGKKWTDYMPEESVKIILEKMPHKGNHELWKTRRKQVVGIKKGKFIGIFESGAKAAEKLGLKQQSISKCCTGIMKKTGGINFFYESDFEKWSKLINE